jgi:hypothetical protein
MSSKEIKLIVQDTTADGNCVFHACLGKFDKKRQKIFKENVHKLRQDIQNILKQYISPRDLKMSSSLKSILFSTPEYFSYRFSKNEKESCGLMADNQLIDNFSKLSDENFERAYKIYIEKWSSNSRFIWDKEIELLSLLSRKNILRFTHIDPVPNFKFEDEEDEGQSIALLNRDINKAGSLENQRLIFARNVCLISPGDENLKDIIGEVELSPLWTNNTDPVCIVSKSGHSSRLEGVPLDFINAKILWGDTYPEEHRMLENIETNINAENSDKEVSIKTLQQTITDNQFNIAKQYKDWLSLFERNLNLLDLKKKSYNTNSQGYFSFFNAEYKAAFTVTEALYSHLNELVNNFKTERLSAEDLKREVKNYLEDKNTQQLINTLNSERGFRIKRIVTNLLFFIISFPLLEIPYITGMALNWRLFPCKPDTDGYETLQTLTQSIETFKLNS